MEDFGGDLTLPKVCREHINIFGREKGCLHDEVHVEVELVCIRCAFYVAAAEYCARDSQSSLAWTITETGTRLDCGSGEKINM